MSMSHAQIECEGNYAAAEMWVQKMEEHGLEMDAKMQRELLKMYNQSDPIQVKRQRCKL